MMTALSIEEFAVIALILDEEEKECDKNKYVDVEEVSNKG
jgi:hypothetical protein